MKIITSVLQLVPALLWQVGVSHLLQAAKGSTRRDSGIQEVRIHCGATGAVFPERGFHDPEVRAQQEPGGPTLRRQEIMLSRSLGALRLQETSTSRFLPCFCCQKWTTHVKMQPDSLPLNGCWPLGGGAWGFFHVPDHDRNTLKCDTAPRTKVLWSAEFLSLQREVYLHYLGKHQTRRHLLVRRMNVKCHSGICQILPVFIRWSVK